MRPLLRVTAEEGPHDRWAILGLNQYVGDPALLGLTCKKRS